MRAALGGGRRLARAHAVFAAAVILALLVSVGLRNTLGYVKLTEGGGYEGDITHYVHWTRLVTLGGIQDAYGGEWPETYAVYPPVTLYGYLAIGTLYQALVDPAFEPERAQESVWLRRAIKGLAVGWHLLAALAVYGLALRLAGPRRAALAGGLYAANPAALFDAAHWGQPDGAHSLFSVLAVGLLQVGLPLWGWTAMGLAALAKPQAWAILPLLLVATLRAGGVWLVVRAGAVMIAVAAVVLLPFIATGRLGEFLTLPSVIAGVMPVVSANAHNAWWLLFAGRDAQPIFTPDSARFLGPLSYRAVAGVLVGVQFLFTYWLYWTRRTSLAEAAALGALGWFLFTTQAHENHLFFVLPLLALAWPQRPALAIPFAVLTLTILANMALHDDLLLDAFGLDEQHPTARTLQALNAAVNLVVWLGWAFAAGLRSSAAAHENALSEMRAGAYTVRNDKRAEVAQW